MKTRRIELHTIREESKYSISVGESLLAGSGKWLRSITGKQAGKVFIVSNPTVFKLYGEAVADALRMSGFDVSSFLMNDGERYKSLETIDAALKAMTGAGVSRTDIVVGLGGGVVGDLAGFAAAIH